MHAPSSPPRPFWLLAGTALLALLANLIAEPLQELDNSWLDLCVRLQSADQPADPRILVIDIDDASLAALAPELGQWPWPRSAHAELVEYLSRQQPAAIVFDLLLPEPDLYRPDSDRYLVEVLARSERVFLPVLHLPGTESWDARPLGELAVPLGLEAGPGADPEQRARLLRPFMSGEIPLSLGSINFTRDGDGIGRRYEVYHRIGGWTLPSLPARVARTLGAPLPAEHSIALAWRAGGIEPYPRLPYARVYQALERGEPASTRFTGKIILIGATAAGLHDLQATPIAPVYPGVSILATAIDNLINQEQLHSLNAPTQLLLALLLLGAALLLSRLSISPLRAMALLGALSLLALGTSHALVGYRWLWPVATPLLIIWATFLVALGLLYRQRQHQHRQTLALFKRFMDPAVVDSLTHKELDERLLAGQCRHLTILFSDIRNFTGISEQRTAVEIVNLLNNYFSRQVAVIFSQQGTLDKFIGDALMAFWGAPLDVEQQEIKAVQAALTMVETLETFKQDYGFHDFDIGIGIHCGEAVVGAIGSAQRADYTAIGDAVNVASRIEGLTKDRARILVSDAVRVACGDHFVFTEVGTFAVKGRREPVTVFAPSARPTADP